MKGLEFDGVLEQQKLIRMAIIQHFEDLEVWQLSRAADHKVFDLKYPVDHRNDFDLIPLIQLNPSLRGGGWAPTKQPAHDTFTKRAGACTTRQK